MSNQPAVRGPDGVLRPYIGGQALIEGVMMRSPRSFAAVLRRRDGSLVVREEGMGDHRKGARALPLVRGVYSLVEALRLGSRALRFSAEVYERDLDDADQTQATAAKKPSTLAALSLPIVAMLTTDPETPSTSGGSGEAGKKLFTLLSIGFALLLFVALPQAAAEGTSRLFGLGLDVRSPGFQLITGGAKVVIIVSYMLAIRRMPEIYRVFQYHGAEHKAIYAYEKGEELVAANAKAQSTLHPRCGTTFLVMVALVSIVVFTALGPLMPQLGLGKLADNVAFFLMKLPFLPVIAAITFEIQRVFARYCTTGPLRVVLWPGFLVQRITTIEPDDGQVEVALAALRATLRRESEPEGGTAGDASFESFDVFSSTTPARSA